MNISGVVNADGSVDLTGKQGSTWGLTLELKDANGDPMGLTDYLARGQIRKNYSATTIIKSFTCEILEPPSDGKITISLSASETALIKCGASKTDPEYIYVYDIEIYTGTPENVSRILQGKLFVDPEVTK